MFRVIKHLYPLKKLCCTFCWQKNQVIFFMIVGDKSLLGSPHFSFCSDFVIICYEEYTLKKYAARNRKRGVRKSVV